MGTKPESKLAAFRKRRRTWSLRRQCVFSIGVLTAIVAVVDLPLMYLTDAVASYCEPGTYDSLDISNGVYPLSPLVALMGIAVAYLTATLDRRHVIWRILLVALVPVVTLSFLVAAFLTTPAIVAQLVENPAPVEQCDRIK